VVNLC